MFNINDALLFIIAVIGLVLGSVAVGRDNKHEFYDVSSGSEVFLGKHDIAYVTVNDTQFSCFKAASTYDDALDCLSTGSSGLSSSITRKRIPKRRGVVTIHKITNELAFRHSFQQIP